MDMLKRRYGVIIVFFSFCLSGCLHNMNQNYSKMELQDIVQKYSTPASLEDNDEDLGMAHFEISEAIPPKEKVDHSKELMDKRTVIYEEVSIPDQALVDSEIQEEENSCTDAECLLEEAMQLCDASQTFWQSGEIEDALSALDQAYERIIKLDGDENPLVAQQKEDLRYTISKRILEIYASRNQVVEGINNEIPIVMNEHVKAEINAMVSGGKDGFFARAYKRSGKYKDIITHELQKAGLPLELFWLPLIESGFTANALSSARALGLWQFIPSTGHKFGLKRDTYIDERLDPEKSTKAAIAYLKELHKMFGDWTTVLAAYNCGEGKVLKAIRNQNLNYLDNFWDLYERLPRETARYVPRFLATLHIVQNLEQYGLESLELDSPLQFDTVNVSKQVHLKHVAASIGVSENILYELNPELRYKIIPKNEYVLKVPPEKADTLLSKMETIPESKIPIPTRIVYHKVKRGETLSVIAKKYQTSVNKIMSLNKLRKKHYIVAGDILKIPRFGS